MVVDSISAIAAALAIGLSALGYGYAYAHAGAAAAGVLAELHKENIFGKILIILAMPESALVFGLIVSVMILFL